MYTPDGITARKRREKLSHNAFDIYLYLCERANQETGFCYPSDHTISNALEMRVDHVKTYKKELINAGWIVEGTENGNKGFYMKAGWLPLSVRRKKSEIIEQTQDELTKTWETSQNLVNEPEILPNFGKMYENSTQNLGRIYQTLGTHNKELTRLNNHTHTLGSEPEPFEPSDAESVCDEESDFCRTLYDYRCKEIQQNILPKSAVEYSAIRQIFLNKHSAADAIECYNHLTAMPGRKFPVTWVWVSNAIGDYKRDRARASPKAVTLPVSNPVEDLRRKLNLTA